MTKLTMMNYLKDRPTMINGVWWGCKGVSRNSAHIVLVTPNNDIIELQRNIKVGESRKFKAGPSVKVTGVQIGYPDAYADINVSGKVAPTAPGILAPTAPGEVCTEGYNTNLVVKIPNKTGGFTSYTYNVYVPTVCVPGAPVMPVAPPELPAEIEIPSISTAKLVKILNIPKIYIGKSVEIIASVLCGREKSDGEYALLTIDGEPVAEGRTGASSLGPGFVTFRWTAEGESGAQRLCVRVPKSDVCPDYAEAIDCRIVMISSVRPSLEQQLAEERGELRQRLESIRHERDILESLRTDAVGFPTVKLPEIIIPEPEIDVDIGAVEEAIEEVEEVAEEVGTIMIPSIPVPEKLTLLPTVSIDNIAIGYPPINVDVTPGKHQIKVELKGLAPIYKTVTVKSDQVITITNLSFM